MIVRCDKNFVPFSSEVAKGRLLWLKRQRDNGGVWTFAGVRYTGRGLTGMRKQVLRWRWV